ncbi:MAG: Fur family transcriptional regulator [Bryobacteraceae bacterium]
MDRIISILRTHGIHPTPQRIAVAQCVMGDKSHPSADQVWARVKTMHPTVSRATIYNTLNLFAEKHLLKAQVLSEGTVVFDSQVAPHHHFIDQKSGTIHDIPWDAVKVTGALALPSFEVYEYQVVMRGRKRREA